MANKENIVTKISEKSGFTKKATCKFLDAFNNVLVETLANGERFHIHEVFTMVPVHKEACMRRNPKTQEKVKLSDYIKVKTVIGSGLEKALEIHEKEKGYTDER